MVENWPYLFFLFFKNKQIWRRLVRKKCLLCQNSLHHLHHVGKKVFLHVLGKDKKKQAKLRLCKTMHIMKFWQCFFIFDIDKSALFYCGYIFLTLKIILLVSMVHRQKRTSKGSCSLRLWKTRASIISTGHLSVLAFGSTYYVLQNWHTYRYI